MGRKKKEVEQPVETPVKRRPGRPRKIKTPEELAKLNKPKLTLEQKQELKLKRQKERQAKKAAEGNLEPKNKDRFYCTNKELQAELIKWRDSADEPEDRILSEELGRMLLAIANKFLNHSNFRNYSKELKEDMRSYGLYKVIRGLKNYNFKFNNPFSWVTQAFYNAFLTIIGKHYKHINTKKELLKKFMSELEGISGISPNNAISKCIQNYLGSDANQDE